MPVCVSDEEALSLDVYSYALNTIAIAVKTKEELEQDTKNAGYYAATSIFSSDKEQNHQNLLFSWLYSKPTSFNFCTSISFLTFIDKKF